MTEESNPGDAHPQTASFHFLFPKPTLQTPSNCLLEAHFKDLWNQKFSEKSLTFFGLSAKPPNFDRRQAELGGNDYACAICAHFGRTDEATNDISMVLGHIPYPNNKGEFVLQGNRYIFPVYLRTSKQYNNIKEKLLGKDLKSAEDAVSATNDPDQREDERKTENLHIVSLHELIEHRYIRRLKWVFETIESNSLDGDLRLLRMSLRRWLRSGNNTLQPISKKTK